MVINDTSQPAANAAQPGRLERLAFVLGFVVALVPGAGFLAGRLDDHFIVNSDYLLLPELLTDLANGGSVDRWIVPYATYLIPDWPLYSLALLVTPSATLAVALFAFLQSALLFLAARRLCRVFAPANQSLFALCGLSLIVLFTITNAVPLVYLATAYTHVGTVILLIAALAFTLDWLATAEPRLVWLSTAVSAAAVMSDRLFVLWFLAPAALTLGWLVLRRHLSLRLGLTWLLPHLVASVMVLPISGLIFQRRSEYDLSLGFSEPRAGFDRFIDTLQYVADYSTVLIPLLGVVVLAVGWQLRQGRSLAGAKFGRATALFVAVFFVVSAGGTALAQVMMIGDVAPGPRYSLPILVLPLLLVAPILLSGLQSTSTWGTAVLALVSAPAVASIVILASLIPELDSNQSPVESACIDEVLADSGATRGIASYWDARTVEVFSNGTLDVAPYGPLLFESHINVGLDGFTTGYDFAVTSEIYPGWGIEQRILDAAAGPPLNQTTCGRWLVSVWPNGGLAVAGLLAPGDQRTFSGCEMSSHLATATEDCQLIVGADEETREFLVFGPYLHVPAGGYELSVSYASPHASDHVVGAWDVAADTPTDTAVLVADDLTGTNGANLTFTASFTIPEQERSTALLQWRLITNGSVDVSFDSLTLTRTS